MLTKQVAWGDGLVVALHHAGGLRKTVDHIRALMGDTIGTRNTFAKLLRETDPADIDNDRDRWRAWLLLSALGLDPAEWGISDNVPAPDYITDLDDLRQRLLLPSKAAKPQPNGCRATPTLQVINPRKRSRFPVNASTISPVITQRVVSCRRDNLRATG